MKDLKTISIGFLAVLTLPIWAPILILGVLFWMTGNTVQKALKCG